MHEETIEGNEPRSAREVEPAPGGIVTLRRHASVREAVELMRDHHVGDVIIIDEDAGGRPVGMVTDRDVALCVVDGAVDIEHIRVTDIMSDSVVVAKAEDDLFSAIRQMKAHGVTRLPIVDASGRVTGIITARKAIKLLTEALRELTAIADAQQAREARTHH
jgi:CBS domain-containing protein